MKRNITTIHFFALNFGLLAIVSDVVADQKNSTTEFAIVIPSYNNEKYYEENLNSACWQESTNPYHIYYINDASADATGRLVEEYVKKNSLQEKVTIIHNTTNIGAGANTYNTIHNFIEDHKVVVMLDGDDSLSNNKVLLTLENYYKNPKIWMTYGVLQTLSEPQQKASKIDWVIKNNMIRKHARASHLRTFKAGLYKKVRKEDFYYNGEFMKVAHDTVWVLAMLEMSRPKNKRHKNHSAFTKEVLYNYRWDNPISDFRVKGELQKILDAHIRSLRPYKSLGKLN